MQFSTFKDVRRAINVYVLTSTFPLLTSFKKFRCRLEICNTVANNLTFLAIHLKCPEHELYYGTNTIQTLQLIKDGILSFMLCYSLTVCSNSFCYDMDSHHLQDTLNLMHQNSLLKQEGCKTMEEFGGVEN